jgi:hypothetical protein
LLNSTRPPAVGCGRGSGARAGRRPPEARIDVIGRGLPALRCDLTPPADASSAHAHSVERTDCSLRGARSVNEHLPRRSVVDGSRSVGARWLGRRAPEPTRDPAGVPGSGRPVTRPSAEEVVGVPRSNCTDATPNQDADWGHDAGPAAVTSP